jgi:membrane associated rhomboid family serine protease
VKLKSSPPPPLGPAHVSDAMRLTYALWFTMAFLVAIWSVFVLNEVLDLGWRKHGVHPRSVQGLTGILTYPFLHGDWGHLWNNTMSFFTLNGFLFYFYRSIALRVWLWLFFLSGLMLWGLAVDGNHIGASGIIYGLAAFLFTSGVIRNNRLLLRVSLAVAFLYGGIVWWMLPIDDHVSWEGHLSGAVTGTLLALAFRRQGPKDPVYNFEREELEDGTLPEWWMAAHPNHPDTLAHRERESREQDAPTTTTSTPPPRFGPSNQS